MLKFCATFIIGLLLAHNALCNEIAHNAISEIDADIVFMRHALAPGFGDPENFLLSDCSTQRNLSNIGQKQALKIGTLLASSQVQFDTVLSSYWCRCYDTARLMSLGEVVRFSGLNSFFQGHVNKEETLLELQNYFNEKPDERLALMVTHQVVISAVTGIYTNSGEFVAYNSKTGDTRAFTLDISP